MNVCVSLLHDTQEDEVNDILVQQRNLIYQSALLNLRTCRQRGNRKKCYLRDTKTFTGNLSARE